MREDAPYLGCVICLRTCLVVVVIYLKAFSVPTASSLPGSSTLLPITEMGSFLIARVS